MIDMVRLQRQPAGKHTPAPPPTGRERQIDAHVFESAARRFVQVRPAAARRARF
jgi:hypothetical protein